MVGQIVVHCDNQAIIIFTKDLKFHSRIKYIETQYNFVRDIIVKREVSVKYISTHHMVIDLLTKRIPREVYLAHIKSLGLGLYIVLVT